MNELFLFVFSQSLKGAVLVVLILLLRQLFGRRLSPGTRHAVWLLLPLTLCLAIPVGLPFGWPGYHESSISNLVGSNNIKIPEAILEPETGQESEASGFDWNLIPQPMSQESQQAIPVDSVSRTSFVQASVGDIIVRILLKSLSLFAPIWAVGVGLLLGLFVMQAIRCHRLLAVAKPVMDSDVLQSLQHCREMLGLKSWIVLSESEKISAPFLVGVLRPVVLLPSSMLINVRHDRMSRKSLEHVFLHELAHLKRGDLWTGWLMSLFVISHWFNPLLWTALVRMNADREEACDAMAMRHIEIERTENAASVSEQGNKLRTTGIVSTGTISPPGAWSNDRIEYGNTLLDLAGGLVSKQTVLSASRAGILAGILEGPSQLQRRIDMIRNKQHWPKHWNLFFVALALIVSVSLIAETQAKDEKKKKTEKQNIAETTAPADEDTTAESDEFDKDDPSSQFSDNKPIKPGKYEGEDAEEIARRIMGKAEEVNRHWLWAPKWDAKRWTYTFCAQLSSGEKMEKKKELDREDPKAPSDWPSIRGNTMIPVAQGLCEFIVNDPENIRIEGVDVTKNQIKILFRFKKPNSAFQMIGNGLDGSWYGFFQSRATEGMLYVNPENYTLIGVKMPNGNSEKYADYVALDDEHQVPRRIEIVNGKMSFEMRFKAYEPGIWLLDKSEYKLNKKKTSVAQLFDLTINGTTPVEIGEK